MQKGLSLMSRGWGGGKAGTRLSSGVAPVCLWVCQSVAGTRHQQLSQVPQGHVTAAQEGGSRTQPLPPASLQRQPGTLCLPRSSSFGTGCSLRAARLTLAGVLGPRQLHQPSLGWGHLGHFHEVPHSTSSHLADTHKMSVAPKDHLHVTPMTLICI